MSDEPRHPHEEEEETEYIGNIWGWKFSFISLAIILATMGLMMVRYYTMDNPPDSIFFFPEQPGADTTQTDTTQLR